MRVAFRTDASIDIGNGHVMRCLTLAAELREHGATCLFVCRRHEGHLIEKIRQSGFEVAELPPHPTVCSGDGQLITASGANDVTDAHQTRDAIGSDIDWLVVDHYGIDARWEAILRSPTLRLLVIDDTADRSHDADVLVDHNAGRKPSDYRGLLPEHCQVYAGPAYALLRSQFTLQRRRGLRPSTQLRQLLVFMGGVDKANATTRVLQHLRSCTLPEDMMISVVMGPHAPHLDHVRQVASTMPWPTEVLTDIDDMASLMHRCDLAIGAAGVSALERCCVGLPSLIIPVAANQLAGARAIVASGGALLASIDSHGLLELPAHFDALIDHEGLHAASLASATITEGKGAAFIAELMIAQAAPRLRRMQEADLAKVLLWRNAPEIRRWMLNADEISPENHAAWFLRASADPDRALLLVEVKGAPIGFVQFSGLRSREAPEWGFYVAPDAPKGSGATLGKLALTYAFVTLGLTRLIGRTLTANGPSIRFHEKFGFRCLGTSDEEPSPALMTYELLREDWEHAQGVTA